MAEKNVDTVQSQETESPVESLTDKVSVNINSSTLAAIDLLVDNGYYSNRSDFINQALRDSLDRRQTVIDRLLEESKSGGGNDRLWFFGVSGIGAGEVEACLRRNRRIRIVGYGVFMIDESIEPAKLFAVLSEIRVRGRVVCKNKEIREHYRLK